MNLSDDQELATLRIQLDEAQGLSKIRHKQITRLRALLVGTILLFSVLVFSATIRILYSEDSSTQEADSIQLSLTQEAEALTENLRLCRDGMEKEVERCTALGVALNALSEKPVTRIPETETALGKIRIGRPAGLDQAQYETLCKAGRGNLEACTEVAILLIDDASSERPDPKKWAAAHKWLKWGCPETLTEKQSLRDIIACEKLGRAFNLGRGIRADKELAKLYLGHACDVGSAVACRDLGYIYYRRVLISEGTLEDLQKSRGLLTAACIGDDASGCHYLAFTLLADANVGTQNIWRIFRKSCELGLSDACAIINKTYPDRPRWAPAMRMKKDDPEPSPEFLATEPR